MTKYETVVRNVMIFSTKISSNVFLLQSLSISFSERGNAAVATLESGLLLIGGDIDSNGDNHLSKSIGSSDH